MPPRLWEQRVEDMLDAVAKIQRATSDKTFSTFVADEVLIAAVCYFILVIGEASLNIPSEIQGRAPSIPWDEIRGMRNRLVHQYFQVSLPIVWDVARYDLQPLAEKLQTLLVGPERA